MLKTELGPFLYQYAQAANTLTFTPVPDRGALVRSIGITAPSATDNWIVTSKGKEIMRLRVRNSGNMNAVRADDQGAGFHTDFFQFCRNFVGREAAIPVPLGQQLQIRSAAGATADLLVQFEEHDQSDLGPSNTNHPDGTEWLIPVYTYLNAAVAAAGVINDDTQVGPLWLPNFFTGVMLTSAWKIQLLAGMFEGVGVNTFSGAANHQSTTLTKRLVLDSKQLASRTTNGIPNLGVPSAAGSANTVFGQALGEFAPFEKLATPYDALFNYPIQLSNGDTFNVAEEIAGDVTGGASYEPALALWVARISQVV